MRTFSDRFESSLAWLVAGLVLLSLTMFGAVGLVAEMTIGTPSPYVPHATPGGLMPGIGVASRSSTNTRTSSNTSSSSAGSSMETVFSIRCRTKRIENYDGCNTLVTSDCNGEEYTELVPCPE